MGRRRQESPWCTLAEAADYLGYKRTETLDPRLTDSEKAIPGKIRRRILGVTGQRRVRLWRKDVMALLPPFEP